MVADSRGVIVVGSLHYDIMIDAGGWPQQGETIAAIGWRPKLGGKGRNQAVAAREAGATVMMVGRVGADDLGRELKIDLEARGIDTHFVVQGRSSSGMSVAITDESGDYRAFIVSSANLELDASDFPPASALREVGVMILQNEISEKANIAAAKLAAQTDVMVLLNAAPYRQLPRAVLGAVDLLVVNSVEAAQLGGLDEPRTLGDALNAARNLAARAGAVIVTAGAAGSAYADSTQALAVPARTLQVSSSHGAGDAFVGALGAALAGGRPIEAAMIAATDAAAHLLSKNE
jgi:ribokinase